MDGRPLNDITVTDGYPMPRAEELIQKMCGRLFFSVIDLKSAYWQIAYDFASVRKACVHTPGGVRAYTVMVMGLKNSAATLQRVIEGILKGLSGKVVFVYLDDVGMPEDDFKKAVGLIVEVLSRFMKAYLAISASKCKFLMEKIPFLGHLLDKHGYRPGTVKTQQILDFPQPTNREELVRFIGMVNYFRRFIPHFTEEIWDLENEKNAKARGYQWNEKMQAGFVNLKRGLANCVSAVKPVYDDPDRPFHLYTDASIKAIGWCLAQPTEVQSDGKRYIKPILFNSRRLS